jgi:hypothetical protein
LCHNNLAARCALCRLWLSSASPSTLSHCQTPAWRCRTAGRRGGCWAAQRTLSAAC